MRNELRRRTFLKLLALASANVLTGCANRAASTSAADATNAEGNGRDVVVLGGGLAGLCAAYELRQRGFHVVAILEAQKRIGGRVFTQRVGHTGGQYAELGATRIADTHTFTLKYCQQFGIGLSNFPTGDGLYHVRGKTFRHHDGDAWPDFFNLAPADRKKSPDEIVLSYENLTELGDPTRSDWPTGKALEYDAMSICDYLKSKGANDDVLIIDRAINGSEVDVDAALYWLMADVVDAKWDKTCKMTKGNDQLSEAFAASLGDVVKRECIVTRMDQQPGHVTIGYQQNGIARDVRASLVVCSLPFSTLRHIDLSKANFSADKLRVIADMHYIPISRANVQTKTRFWKEMGLGGLKVARTDTQLERFWDMTLVQDGQQGILTSYMMDKNALTFAALAPSARLDWVKQRAQPFFPELASQAENATYKIWQDDPWVRGGWGYYQKGEARNFPIAKRREGRVFFCGEHTSPWTGWMQGAFESANRVLAEITNGA